MNLELVTIEKPEDVNLVLGQAHFVKTVDDLHQALALSAPTLRFGIAFCEASGPRLVRVGGNDEELSHLAERNLHAIGAGHAFLVLLREGFPVNVLNAIKQLPEVCHIFCATANDVQVVVAPTDQGRGILGVVDGFSPVGVESADDLAARRALLRALGYTP